MEGERPSHEGPKIERGSGSRRIRFLLRSDVKIFLGARFGAKGGAIK